MIANKTINAKNMDGNDAAGFGISWGNPTIISPEVVE